MHPCKSPVCGKEIITVVGKILLNIVIMKSTFYLVKYHRNFHNMEELNFGGTQMSF